MARERKSLDFNQKEEIKQALNDASKPIASEAEIQKNGEVKGYFRIVEFEDGAIIESKFSMVALSNNLLRAIEGDEDLADMLKMTLKRYKMRKDPMGKMTDELMMAKREMDLDATGECNCAKCQARREVEKAAQN